DVNWTFRLRRSRRGQCGRYRLPQGTSIRASPVRPPQSPALTQPSASSEARDGTPASLAAGCIEEARRSKRWSPVRAYRVLVRLEGEGMGDAKYRGRGGLVPVILSCRSGNTPEDR